ncbi:MAG TPA: hypothetical protein DEO38_06725 [Bacteroidales bacterium]|jgi:regulator of cell morphogenesis and NO signaling|nr:hypothetical protein [Bacteroidales bacterium]
MYSLNNRLIDIISASPAVVLLLSRFGISLGFGNATIDEVCHKNNVPADLFLMISNIYADDHYRVSKDTLKRVNLEVLFCYLRRSHDFYINDRLPHIQRHLDKVAASAAEKGDVLRKYFQNFLQQAARHFRAEEQKLFPVIEQMARGENVDTQVIVSFEEHHDRLDEQLSDLTQLVFKYIPGVDAEFSTEMLFDIVVLNHDLQKHAIIEERVLLPYIKMITR